MCCHFLKTSDLSPYSLSPTHIVLQMTKKRSPNGVVWCMLYRREGPSQVIVLKCLSGEIYKAVDPLSRETILTHPFTVIR